MGKILSIEYSFWDTHAFDLTFSLVMVITPTLTSIEPNQASQYEQVVKF